MEPALFTIHVPNETLVDLRDRLGRVRWPDEIPGSGWEYGTSLAYLKELVGYWRDNFDWRSQEAKLNQFQQYIVPQDGIDLHFIHQPGVGPNPLPLLLCHGWPGSIWEFHKLIPLLTIRPDLAAIRRPPSPSWRRRCRATPSPSSPVSHALIVARWRTLSHG